MIREKLTQKGLLTNKKMMPFVQDQKVSLLIQLLRLATQCHLSRNLNCNVTLFTIQPQKRIQVSGPSSFDRALSFNEYETLRTAIEYFKRSLGYHSIQILFKDQWTEEDARAAELAVPGEPAYAFKNEPEQAE